MEELFFKDKGFIRPVRIYTFGRFMICGSGGIYSEVQPRAQKLWDLFKYLLAHMNKSIPAESILENLYPDKSYEDPKGAVRNLIYRLRKLLTDAGLYTDDYIQIRFADGCYKLEANSTEIDTERFEQLIALGNKARGTDALEAINCYAGALDIYRGSYLSELIYMDWVVLLRNYYRRMFLDCCNNLFSLLSKQRMHNETIRLAEKAMLAEPYEEDIHIWFLSALVEEGRIRQAQRHYEYITGVLYNQFGIKPSKELRSIYNRIMAAAAGRDEGVTAVAGNEGVAAPGGIMGSGGAIPEDGARQQKDGAYLCDMKTFRSIYDLCSRQRATSETKAFLLTLDIAGIGSQLSGRHAGILPSVLANKLRRGDVICQWSDSRYLILLSGINSTDVDKVIDRLRNGVRDSLGLDGTDLSISFEPVLPMTGSQGHLTRAGIR
ncbi:MAG TPA: BTAD domain-containing putative transcriptional regulator [Candidatus Atribacteria bacterium]|nr:BTAD domain-containing putative transcriptional regulator [Candidatus Atribacteria bacterium]